MAIGSGVLQTSLRRRRRNVIVKGDEMKRDLFIASLSIVAAVVFTLQAGVAYADDEESPVAAIASAEPSVLTSVAPVDSSADDPEHAINATIGATDVTIPEDAKDDVTLSGSGGSLRIALPFADQADPASAEAQGIVSYDNGNGTTTVPIVNADGSVTIATVISDSAAPSSFAYRFESVDGVHLEATEDGGAMVMSGDGTVVAVVAAPWAKDATGTDVPTVYEIDGDTLRQHVDLSNPDIVYPVVADPNTTFVWWGTATKLTRSETKSLAQNISSSAAGVAAFCGYVPVVPGRVACALAVAWRISSWIDPIKQAAAEGKCAQINIPYGSGPALWNVTKERC